MILKTFSEKRRVDSTDSRLDKLEQQETAAHRETPAESLLSKFVEGSLQRVDFIECCLRRECEKIERVQRAKFVGSMVQITSPPFRQSSLAGQRGVVLKADRKTALVAMETGKIRRIKFHRLLVLQENAN